SDGPGLTRSRIPRRPGRVARGSDTDTHGSHRYQTGHDRRSASVRRRSLRTNPCASGVLGTRARRRNAEDACDPACCRTGAIHSRRARAGSHLGYLEGGMSPQAPPHMPDKRYKVVLYNPQAVFFTLPLALLAIGSELDPQRYEVIIVDARLEDDPEK